MPPSPSAVSPPATFRVLTFNLWADRSETRPESQSWKRRRPLIESLLRFHRPDLIGFQEVVHSRALQLAEALPGHGWIGVGRRDGREGGELNPIFYRRELFRPIDSGTFWLSPTPQTPSRGWGAAYPRIATWAILEETGGNSSGTKFLFCNTHFDHGSPRARRESAALLLRKLAELAPGPDLNRRRIVAGDLNCRPGSAPHRLLTAELRDTAACSQELPLGPTPTWRGMFRGMLPPARLDYLLVGAGIAVRQAAVLADHWDGRFPSDHLPVVADLSFLPETGEPR